MHSSRHHSYVAHVSHYKRLAHIEVVSTGITSKLVYTTLRVTFETAGYTSFLAGYSVQGAKKTSVFQVNFFAAPGVGIFQRILWYPLEDSVRSDPSRSCNNW